MYWKRSNPNCTGNRRDISTEDHPFFGLRQKRCWNDRKKLSHFGQNVWKYRLKHFYGEFDITETNDRSVLVTAMSQLKMTEMFQQKKTDHLH